MRLLILLFVSTPSLAFAQGYPVAGGTFVQHGASQVAILPPVGGVDGRNSAGWGTGYSVVTSTQERSNPLGAAWGGSDTVVETVTKVVPNDALGRPMRGGIRPFEEPNSAGWSTGYSAVTSTYERPDPFGAALGGSKTVTETTTRIVPNDALGNPLQPILPLWP
jgi:hypothetical protein